MARAVRQRPEAGVTCDTDVPHNSKDSGKAPSLLALPDEIVAHILRACDVATKMKLPAVCKKFNDLLAHPTAGDDMWGVITVPEDGAVPMGQLMRMIPWLMQRSAGIRKIVLRFLERGRLEPTYALHTMLFTLAGAFKGSHVTLEVRQPTLNDIDEYPFEPQFWSDPGCEALASQLTALEMQCQLSDQPAQDLQRFCSLAALEEAWLGFATGAAGEVWLPEFRPPQGGLCSLQRLTLNMCDPHCSAALLSATGAQLTHLRVICPSAHPVALDAVAQLATLQELQLDQRSYTGITTNFGRMKALTHLHVDFSDLGEDPDEATDYAWLGTFPALRNLQLHSLNGVNESLLTAILALPPTLEHVNLSLMYNWPWAAANIGRLRARMAVERPTCRVEAMAWDEYNDYF